MALPSTKLRQNKTGCTDIDVGWWKVWLKISAPMCSQNTKEAFMYPSSMPQVVLCWGSLHYAYLMSRYWVILISSTHARIHTHTHVRTHTNTRIQATTHIQAITLIPIRRHIQTNTPTHACLHTCRWRLRVIAILTLSTAWCATHRGKSWDCMEVHLHLRTTKVKQEAQQQQTSLDIFPLAMK